MRILVLSLVLAGCEMDGASPVPVRRDSAGVVIVESGAAVWGSGGAWQIGERAVATIGEGSVGPEYEFQEIADVVRLSDGRIVVGDRGVNEIRYYDAAGRHTATVGGTGSGPGEFRALQMVARLSGDTLYALDRRANRISVFDGEGSVVRTVALPTDVAAVYSLPDGSWIGATAEGYVGSELDPNAPVGLRRDPAPILLLSADGHVLDTIVAPPGEEIAMIDVGGRRGAVPAAFGRILSLAVQGSELYVATGDVLGFDVHSADGTLLRRVRAPEPDRSIDGADLERFREAILAQMPDGVVREQFALALARAQVPERKAAVSRILLDSAGNVWLSAYENPYYSTGGWHVFDATGRLLGTVNSPPQLRIFDVGESYVAGVWRDELGVESVRVYPLRR